VNSLNSDTTCLREEINYPHNVCIEQGKCHIRAFEILHRSTANEELPSKRHVCTSDSEFLLNNVCETQRCNYLTYSAGTNGKITKTTVHNTKRSLPSTFSHTYLNSYQVDIYGFEINILI